MIMMAGALGPRSESSGIQRSPPHGHDVLYQGNRGPGEITIHPHPHNSARRLPFGGGASFFGFVQLLGQP